MAKARMLDICCCEGGGTAGYQRAGFEVFAIDMEPKFIRRNPAEAFHAGDGLVALRTLNDGGMVRFRRSNGKLVDADLGAFDGVHVSPPCQGYTRGNAGRETSWPKLIPDFRELLDETGLPYIIENVKDAGYAMKSPIGLCGCMFDLSTIDDDGIRIHLERLRLFETNWPLDAPRDHDHSDHEWVAGAYGGARRDKYEAKYIRKGGYVPPNKDVVKALLGISPDHDMTWNGLYECLPPAYTEYIGDALMEHLLYVGGV